MMMFALSKINLLILVVALFTIIVYFTFGFQEVLIANNARQEVGKVIEQTAFLVTSKNLCGSIEVSVPEKLSAASGGGMYFLMEIRSVELNDSNSLIFSVINRDEFLRAKRKGEEPTIVASDRRNLKSAIHIFSIESGINDLCYGGSAMLGFGIYDLPVDSAAIIKEIKQGQDHVYIIPCSSASDSSCEENAHQVACWIKQNRGEKSNCFDLPDDCSSYDIQDCS